MDGLSTLNSYRRPVIELIDGGHFNSKGLATASPLCRESMGLIYKTIRVSGNKGSKDVKALFDSGASESFIRADVAKQLSSPTRLPNPKQFEMGKGTLKVTRAMIGDVQLNGATLFATLLIVPKLTEELILGADFFQRWKIGLNPENEAIILDLDALKLKLV